MAKTINIANGAIVASEAQAKARLVEVSKPTRMEEGGSYINLGYSVEGVDHVIRKTFFSDQSAQYYEAARIALTYDAVLEQLRANMEPTAMIEKLKPIVDDLQEQVFYIYDVVFNGIVFQPYKETLTTDDIKNGKVGEVQTSLNLEIDLTSPTGLKSETKAVEKSSFKLPSSREEDEQSLLKAIARFGKLVEKK